MPAIATRTESPPKTRRSVRKTNGTPAKPPLFLLDRSYYRPSKRARTLAVLDALSRDSGLTQQDLA